MISPCGSSAAKVSSIRSCELSAMTTFIPSPSSARASARPMPLAPPVITATRPWKSCIMLLRDPHPQLRLAAEPAEQAAGALERVLVHHADGAGEGLGDVGHIDLAAPDPRLLEDETAEQLQ